MTPSPLLRRLRLGWLLSLLWLLAIPVSAHATVAAPTYLSPDGVTFPKATASVTLQ